MLVKELPIALDQEKIATFCQERGIRKLSLWGSNEGTAARQQLVFCR